MNDVHKRNSCEFKVRHATKSSAKAAMKAVRKHQRGDKFEVYSCIYCAGFHFGHVREDHALTPIEPAVAA